MPLSLFNFTTDTTSDPFLTQPGKALYLSTIIFLIDNKDFIKWKRVTGAKLKPWPWVTKV